MTTKHIELRYFASVREALGKTNESYQTQAQTVAQIRSELAQRDELHQAAFNPERVLRSAVNQVMVDEQTVVSDGDEVAFFPPVTGG